MSPEKETEEKIFEAAQQVFQEKGFTGARMQEIADRAQINKSMLHYYYRSKEKLFLMVFQAAARKILPQLVTILSSDIPLEDKVRQIVEFYDRVFSKHPSLPSFVIHEMNQNPKRFREFISAMGLSMPETFVRQIREEVESGRMMPIEPHQFLLNVVGLSLMPVIARNMVQTLFRLDDQEYRKLLDERKEMIPKMIFSGVSP